MGDQADATDGAHPPAPGAPLGPLAGWVGTWRGAGRGDFPTIEAFAYAEEVTFAATGKPMLAYAQRTRGDDGRPLHAESGFVRRVGDADADTGQLAVEWTIAQPTGLVEAAAGMLLDGAMETSSLVHGTPTAVQVHAVRRRYVVDGDVLTYDLWMATADVPEVTHHLHAELHRA